MHDASMRTQEPADEAFTHCFQVAEQSDVRLIVSAGSGAVPFAACL